MSQIRFDRLQKVANHLRSGVLGHAKFDFAHIHQKPFALQKLFGRCGSNGCALGELPVIFPNQWVINSDNLLERECVVKVGGRKADVQRGINLDDAKDFFGLSPKELAHLFYPEQQIAACNPPETPNGLDSDATRIEVARNIEHFITNKGFEEVFNAKDSAPQPAAESPVVQEAQECLKES